MPVGKTAYCVTIIYLALVEVGWPMFRLRHRGTHGCASQSGGADPEPIRRAYPARFPGDVQKNGYDVAT
jgi:hypothetical protein